MRYSIIALFFLAILLILVVWCLLFRFASLLIIFFFFFSSRRRHTRCLSDWNSDVCSSDLAGERLRHRELAVHDLERERRQRARRRAVDDGRGCARIVVRIVARALEQLLIRRPTIHLAAGMGTRSEERRVGKECRRRGARVV